MNGKITLHILLIYNQLKRSILFVLAGLLLLPLVIHAQQKTQLIDLFYQGVVPGAAVQKTEKDEFVEIALQRYEDEIINPQAIIERYPSAKKYLVNDSMMVVKSTGDIQGFIEDLAASSDSRITISNFIFEKTITINLNLYGQLENEVFNASRLTLRHCVFDQVLWIWFSNMNIVIEDCTINEVALINESLVSPRIVLSNNDINYASFWTATPREVVISSNSIGYLEVDQSSAQTFHIIDNDFVGASLDKIGDGTVSGFTSFVSYIRLNRITKDRWRNNLSNESLYDLAKIRDDKLLHINNTERSLSELYMADNRFIDPTGSKLVILDQPSTKMEMINNQFDARLILSSSVSDEFILTNNEFSHVAMDAALPSTPEHTVNINWPELKGKLYYQRDETTHPFFAETESELSNNTDFFNLLGGYSRLLQVYKSYGNLDDANDVFLDIKALHLKRYKYLYRTEGGTTNFFQLYLNQLLRVYTRHGTDPAQAMTASLWIIIFFSIIYFFFPSDWDISSKSKLIQNFRTFVEKNEAGYFRPLLSLTKGFVTSFFNAITLSVNSFVTLGFGTIPTRGLAKYICIFQGFLGWFLLSIFIVALINQILI